MTATTDQSSTRFRIGDLDIFVRSDLRELIDDFAALYPGSTRAESAHGRTIRMDVRNVGRPGIAPCELIEHPRRIQIFRHLQTPWTGVPPHCREARVGKQDRILVQERSTGQ